MLHLATTISETELTIRTLDLVILGVFLAGIVMLGPYYAKRNGTTEEYFLASRGLPGWAVGLSMVGTSVSSVTFLALPAAAFVLDWRQLTPNLMLPLVAVVAVIFIFPIFRHGRNTSAFGFLENRYGPILFALVAGGLMMGGAIAFGFIPRESIAELLLIISASFTGSLLTLFLLGFFTRRVGYQAALAGMTVGIVVNLFLVLNAAGFLPEALRVPVHGYTGNLIVNLVAALVAYPLGVVLWRLGFDRQRDLTGLTVWTLAGPGEQLPAGPENSGVNL